MFVLLEKKTHVLWTKQEKEAVIKHLGMYWDRDYLPGKDACLRCIEKSRPVLDSRHWSAVKYYVMNAKKRAKDQLQQQEQEQQQQAKKMKEKKCSKK